MAVSSCSLLLYMIDGTKIDGTKNFGHLRDLCANVLKKYFISEEEYFQNFVTL